MRIISGERRGASLRTPPGLTTRPTLDRIRESLFSILQGWIPDARVLDLYGGCGSLGLEALSRKAQRVTFVEQDKAALGCLRSNIETLRYDSSATVVAADVWHNGTLQRLKQLGPFDIIFADPPYDHGRDRELLQLGLEVLAQPEGLLILQGGVGLQQRLEKSGIPSQLKLDDARVYGKTELLFFRSLLEALMT